MLTIKYEFEIMLVWRSLFVLQLSSVKESFSLQHQASRTYCKKAVICSLLKRQKPQVLICHLKRNLKVVSINFTHKLSFYSQDTSYSSFQLKMDKQNSTSVHLRYHQLYYNFLRPQR